MLDVHLVTLDKGSLPSMNGISSLQCQFGVFCCLAGSAISSAVMVSNPFCMHTCKVRTSKPWSMEWLYNIGLAHRIKQYIVEHNSALSKHAELDMTSIAESTTIEHLDERVVCKLFGFAAAEDYYAAASSMQFIPQIRTPCLFLIARDDPFLGRLPIEVSLSCPGLSMHMHCCGNICVAVQLDCLLSLLPALVAT